MRYRWMVGAVLFGLSANAYAQQSIADQKAQADLDKVRADTVKALLDTQKAKIDLDKAVAEPLKGLTGGSATVSAGEKTVEAMILGRAATAGAAARVAAALAAMSAPSDAEPFVVIGSTPPTVGHWRVFEREREIAQAKLKAAVDGWNRVHSTKMAFGAIGVATLVATIVPLLKTDTTIAGGGVTLEDAELETAMHQALAKASYKVDEDALQPIDGKADAEALLQPLDSLHGAAVKAYEQEFVPFFQDTKRPEYLVAGANLKAAIADYDALRAGLMAETNGVMGAVVVRRQRDFADAKPARPVLYLTGRSVAFTTTTKKGLTTGFASVPAFGSAAVVIDYAIVAGGRSQRGSVGCVIARRKMAAALDLRVETLPATGAALCDRPAS